MKNASSAKSGLLYRNLLLLSGCFALAAILINLTVLAGDKEPTPPEKVCGTGTPGYWKNHPDAWPAEGIEVGGKVYTYADAIVLLGLPDGDKTITLFRSLISAKLNAVCAESGCVDDAIAAADALLTVFAPGSGVPAKSDFWKGDCLKKDGGKGLGGECLYLILDDYNNGLLCAPSRDSLE